MAPGRTNGGAADYYVVLEGKIGLTRSAIRFIVFHVVNRSGGEQV
jgi:hypothetical protein